MKELGFSIDWRREFSTVDMIYSKFISWQFRTLRKKGLNSDKARIRSVGAQTIKILLVSTIP